MNINDIGNWVKLAEQITTGSWDNYNIDNLFIYKSIAVVSHSNDGSFSTYVMPVSLFTGTTFQVPFGGTPPQGNGFGLARYISATTIAIFTSAETARTEVYGVL